MYSAYTLNSISGVVCPSIAATHDGGAPAARAFEARLIRRPPPQPCARHGAFPDVFAQAVWIDASTRRHVKT
jgi:hypothetical protein